MMRSAKVCRHAVHHRGADYVVRANDEIVVMAMAETALIERAIQDRLQRN